MQLPKCLTQTILYCAIKKGTFFPLSKCLAVTMVESITSSWLKTNVREIRSFIAAESVDTLPADTSISIFLKNKGTSWILTGIFVSFCLLLDFTSQKNPLFVSCLRILWLNYNCKVFAITYRIWKISKASKIFTS